MLKEEKLTQRALFNSNFLLFKFRLLVLSAVKFNLEAIRTNS